MLKLEKQGVLKSFGFESKQESGGRAPSRRRPMEVRGRSPQRCGDFRDFF